MIFGKHSKAISAIYGGIELEKEKHIFELLYVLDDASVITIVDVMHVEKFVCDMFLGTLLVIKGKTKDTLNA